MSRIGRQPIPVPAGVTVSIEPEAVRVNGPKGELSERVHRDIEVTQDGDQLLVTRPTDRGEHRALHGLTRSLVANMVQGVTAGYEKRLEIQGVGYRARSRARTSSSPSATRTRCRSPRPTASNSRSRSPPAWSSRASPSSSSARPPRIRKQRPPEPYKGKGIRYEGEYVARKVGKRA